MNAMIFDETRKTLNIQSAAAALMLLNVMEPGLDDKQYAEKAEPIWKQFLPSETDDRHLTLEEEELSDEMMDQSLELASRLQREFAVRLAN
jgi:hypothetical protein